MGRLLLEDEKKLDGERTVQLKNGMNVIIDFQNDKGVLNLAIYNTALKYNLDYVKLWHIIVNEEDHHIKQGIANDDEADRILENNFNSLIEKILNIKLEYASKEMIKQALKSIEIKFKNNIRMLFYYLLKDYLTESIYAYYKLNNKN